MKDNKNNKNMKNKNYESGYILLFTLIIISVLLLVSLSISRVVGKEVLFSRLVDYNRAAYFAADSGIECAQYLDSVFKDGALGISIILNSTSTGDGEYDFRQNAINNVFFATSTVPLYTNILLSDYKQKVFCASDGTYNQIFDDNKYVSSREVVLDNLFKKESSFNIVGDSNNATTTFGLVIRETDQSTGQTVYRCILVEFGKTKSQNVGEVAESFRLISTGYSSCEQYDKTRVSRTIFRFSND